MFDGLNDKLKRFREDAEEAAEEAAEEQSDAELATDTAESGPAEETTPESATTPPEPATDATADATPDSEADVGIAKKAKSLATGQVIIREEDLDDPLWTLETALLESDVQMDVAEEILEHIRDDLIGESHRITTSIGDIVEDALRDALIEVTSVEGGDFATRLSAADRPVMIVFTGVNGVGKTTSIAKVARYLEHHGYSSVLANGDTFRAGAAEQIGEHAERLDKKVIAHEQGGDPAAVIYDAVEYAEANDIDVVLGDTAGRLHTSDDLMDQLAKIDRVVDPNLTIFVDEAVAGQDAVRRAREFNDAAAIDGAILTKADADAQGGAAISISHATGKPIFFLGTGQGYEDLEVFDPEWLVDQLLAEPDLDQPAEAES
ncbi:MAG: signal recognition particle-docking protein FtsY [Salinarchaeum sp.]